MPKLILFFISLFTLIFLSFSQGEIMINIYATNPDARIFPLGNVDLTGTGTIPSFYVFTLTNTGPNPERITLTITVETDGQDIVTSQSNDFELPVGQTFNISHQEINQGFLIIPDSEGREQRVSFVNSSYNLDAVSNLKDVVASTGKMPSGIYRVRVMANGIGISVESFFDLIITNPTTLYLIYPGFSISNPEIASVNTLSPFFSWNSDAEIFDLFVFDEQPQVNSVPILYLKNYKNKFFQYPTDTAPLNFLTGGQSIGPVRILEYGKTYYWYVETVIPVVSGDPLRIKSDYFSFKILEPSQTANEVSQLWELLEKLLGPEHRDVLKQLKDEGFEPNIIFEDSNPANVSSLIQYINKIEQNQAKVIGTNLY
jgi:hypothetical protein